MPRSDAVLIGHRGFIGSAIADHLESRGVRHVRVGRDNYEDMRGHEADLVINAAGSSDRRRARSDPHADFAANVAATMASLFDFRCDRYVLISSVTVYPDMSDPDATHEAAEIDAGRLEPYGYHKYLAESLVRRYASSWLILRLGPLVGPGLRKNPLYDLVAQRTLFVSPRSSYSYIDTRTVAAIVWDLRAHSNEIFNVCGLGYVGLDQVARELSIPLPDNLLRLPEEHVHINNEKLGGVLTVPTSMEAIRRFVEEWRVAGRPR